MIRSTKKSQLAAMYYLAKVNPKKFRLTGWKNNTIYLEKYEQYYDWWTWETYCKVNLNRKGKNSER